MAGSHEATERVQAVRASTAGNVHLEGMFTRSVTLIKAYQVDTDHWRPTMVTLFHLPQHSWEACRCARVTVQHTRSALRTADTRPAKMTRPSMPVNSLPAQVHAQQVAPPVECSCDVVALSLQAALLMEALLKTLTKMCNFWG